MKTVTCIFSVIMILGAINCTESEMASEGPLLDDPLILGMRADPPVAQGGVTLTFSNVVHWPQGDPSYLWILCLPEYDAGVYDEPMTCVSNHLEPGADLPVCDFSDLENLANPCSLGTEPTAQMVFPPEISALLPPDSEFPAFIHLVVSSAPDVYAHCGEGLANGRPPGDCLGAVKTVMVASDEQTDTNINPVLTDLFIDDVLTDATEIPTLALSADDLHRIVKITMDGSSVDEIKRTTETGDIYMDLDLKLYTDCGSLRYYTPDEDKEEDVWRYFGDYQRQIRCTDAGDGLGIICEEAQVEWIVEEPGECRIICVLYDNFGGLDWREQNVIFQ